MYRYDIIHICHIIGTTCTCITLQCVINCFGRISNLPKAVDTVCCIVLYAVMWSMRVYVTIEMDRSYYATAYCPAVGIFGCA